MSRLICGKCINFQIDEKHPSFDKGKSYGVYGICKIGIWTNSADEAGCWSENGCNFDKPWTELEKWRKTI